MTNDTVYQCGAIGINPARHIVTVSGAEVTLTPTEFRILLYLMENVGIVLSQTQIMVHCLRYDVEAVSRTVTTHCIRLRRKLGAAAVQLKSIREFGYKLEPV